MTDIHKWLATTRDYNTGVELYAKYGTSDFLKKFFGMANNSMSRERLLKELTAILDSKHEPEIVVPVKNQQTEKLKNIRISDAADAPNLIKQAVAERRELYKESSRIHATLTHITDQTERAKAAQKILLNFRRIKEIWKLTDFYDRNRRLPEAVVVNEDYTTHSSIELNRQWSLDYKYIRESYNDPRKAEKVAFRKARLSSIQAILTERDAFQFPNLKLPND